MRNCHFLQNFTDMCGILILVADPLTRLITKGHSSGSTLTKSKSERKEERFRSLVRSYTKAVKDKPHRNVRKPIHLREAGVCLWTRSKTKSNTGLRRRRRMRRETPKTNKTVVAELELEAPFSAKQKGVLHI